MARAGDLLLTYMLEPQPVGSYFDRSRWPLHLTLMQWFAPQGGLQALRQELTLAARNIAPVAVTVGKEALFGPDATIPVNVIADQAPVCELHTVLLNVLRQLGLQVNDVQWVGEGYMAHVTQQGDERRAHEGQRLLINSFHIVRLIDDKTCEIVAEFTLAGR
ncbi:MAG TPA: 2'-5' RNA ligase family protein [Bacillota bacterium]|nr:2'-5' RNA ligase family protein [Bacillota bacterium]